MARSFQGTGEEPPSLAGPTTGHLVAEFHGEEGVPRMPRAPAVARFAISKSDLWFVGPVGK